MPIVSRIQPIQVSFKLVVQNIQLKILDLDQVIREAIGVKHTRRKTWLLKPLKKA